MLKKRILIADDEEHIVMTLRMLLEFKGFEVLTAQDGEEALRLARNIERKPDLILLDVAMPKINGLEACLELKADGATKSIPVVLLSAAVSDVNLNPARPVGADARVTKPYETEQLLEVIEGFLSP